MSYYYGLYISAVSYSSGNRAMSQQQPSVHYGQPPPKQQYGQQDGQQEAQAIIVTDASAVEAGYQRWTWGITVLSVFGVFCLPVCGHLNNVNVSKHIFLKK